MLNMGHGCKVTILMPCLNEVETLGACIKKSLSFLRQSGLRGEILIADNGSTDGSQGLARGLGARVIHVKERGYGAALIAGIAAAEGEFTVMGDSDDSYDFSNLGSFVRELERGADLVMGNRFRGRIAPGAMPFLHRYLGNPVLTFLGRLFFRAPIGDFHCGLRAFRTRSIRELRLQCPGMEFASEMVVKAAIAQYRITEVPTTLYPDGRSRPPHLRTWRDGWRHLKFLLTFGLDWLFFYPGLLLLSAGIFGSTLLFRGPLKLRPNLGLDVHAFVTACMAMILGFQCITFYVFARRRAANLGWLPASQRLTRWLDVFNLDRAALIAAVIGISGLWLFVHSLIVWRGQNLGVIPYASLMRPLTMGLSMLVISTQIVLTGFLADVFATEASAPIRLGAEESVPEAVPQ